MERRDWEPVTGARLIGFGLGVALLLLLIFRNVRLQASHCALTCQNLVPLGGNGSDTT